MRDRPYIDAEFVVIADRPAVQADPGGQWTFWADDFPNLVGIASGTFGALILSWLFHR